MRMFECLNCKHADYRMSIRKIGEEVPGICPKCGGATKVSGGDYPDWLRRKISDVAEGFDIVDFVAVEGRIELEVAPGDSKRAFRSLLAKSRKDGYLPHIFESRGELRLTLVKYPEAKQGRIIINLALFVATVATTFTAGYFFFGNSFLNAGLFSAALMLMLGMHEMGHKVAAWRNGVASTLPYFIPAPTTLGTFGAVINIKSPIPTKEALVEMGAAGPLTGFAIAIPITIIGLSLSVSGSPDTVLPFMPPIFSILQLATLGQISSVLVLNPLTFAGWVVMLLTMFNLIPAGQLDGGHIARALLNPQRHYSLTRALGFGLFVTGLLLPESPLWIWGLLIIMLFRGHHPGALDDMSGLSGRHKVIAAVAMVVFLLCLPVPVL